MYNSPPPRLCRVVRAVWKPEVESLAPVGSTPETVVTSIIRFDAAYAVRFRAIVNKASVADAAASKLRRLEVRWLDPVEGAACLNTECSPAWHILMTIGCTKRNNGKATTPTLFRAGRAASAGLALGALGHDRGAAPRRRRGRPGPGLSR